MARYDSKKRKLDTGETQDRNKNSKEYGIYIFTYTDLDGKRKKVRSWRLLPTDPVPQGKKWTKSLKEMENDIQKRMEKGLYTTSLTLEDAILNHIETCQNWSISTKETMTGNYKNHLAGTQLVQKRIVDIRYSDLYKFYLSKMDHPSAAKTTNNLLSPVFKMALRDCIINQNPNTGAYTEAYKRFKPKEKEKEVVLTLDQQRRFLKYLEQDRKNQDILSLSIVALSTGMRSGELFGLTWDEVDFNKGIININHQLRRSTTQAERFYISLPKHGKKRIVPLLKDTKAVLLAERNKSMPKGIGHEIDGISGFIMLNRMGKIQYAAQVDCKLKRIVEKYNAQCKPGEELPSIHLHTFRHTFCSRLCQNCTDLKLIQTIMGHSDIRVTMDVYAKYTEVDIINSISQLDEKLTVM